MICIECGHSVASLYTVYSNDNIKVTACSHCNNFADKYIEYDPIIVGLDVALLKPQAIRHVVYNVLMDRSKIDSQWMALPWRLHLLSTLFDVYIRWAWEEKNATAPQMTQFLARTSTLQQYLSFFVVSVCGTAATQGSIFLLTRLLTPWHDYGALFTALLLSSMSKLLPLLTLIWEYDMPQVMTISWYIIGLFTADFLHVIVGCSYFKATLITATALVVRFWVCDRVLWPLLCSLKLN